MRCLVGIFLAIMLMAAIQPTEAESSGGESSDETILSTAYFEGGWVQFVGLTGDAENESESVDSGVEARFYSPMGELNSIVEIEQPCMLQGNMMAENDVDLIVSEFGWIFYSWNTICQENNSSIHRLQFGTFSSSEDIDRKIQQDAFRSSYDLMKFDENVLFETHRQNETEFYTISPVGFISEVGEMSCDSTSERTIIPTGHQQFFVRISAASVDYNCQFNLPNIEYREELLLLDGEVVAHLDANSNHTRVCPIESAGNCSTTLNSYLEHLGGPAYIRSMHGKRALLSDISPHLTSDPDVLLLHSFRESDGADGIIVVACIDRNCEENGAEISSPGFQSRIIQYGETVLLRQYGNQTLRIEGLFLNEVDGYYSDIEVRFVLENEVHIDERGFWGTTTFGDELSMIETNAFGIKILKSYSHETIGEPSNSEEASISSPTSDTDEISPLEQAPNDGAEIENRNQLWMIGFLMSSILVLAIISQSISPKGD